MGRVPLTPTLSPRRAGRGSRAGEPSRQLGYLSLRETEFKRVERHRDHGVIAAQPDDFDQPTLGERLHGLIIQRLAKPMAFVQRFGDVIDYLALRVVETRRAAIANILDDLRIHT